MKLFDARGPNPKAVRMFAQEVGVSVSLIPVDMMGGENRQEDFLAKNPLGQLPLLETESGLLIAEVVAICEYLDELASTASLIGNTAEERATTRMWTRRIDLNILQPMANGFRFSEGLEFFQNRIRCQPEAAEGLKSTARDWLTWLDGDMSGRLFVAGETFSLADVMLYANVDFFRRVGQPIDPNWQNISNWHQRVSARPSARA